MLGLVNRLAVPDEVETFQCSENRIGRASLLAWRIDVFYPYEPAPSVLTRMEKARDCRDQRADMKGTSRRGREATRVSFARRPFGDDSRYR